MNLKALADCAVFLDVGHDDVLALRDDADLLHALIARLGLALTSKTAPRDAGLTFIEALSRGWGTRPFLASELIAWCEQEGTATQREVFAAARALCGLTDDADLTPQNLGCALRTLVPRLRIAGSRRGSTLWALRDLRD